MLRSASRPLEFFGERRTECLVSERHAILDVGREVVCAGSRNYVYLQRHAGRRASLDPRNRRVDPFVQVNLVSRVEEDPEKTLSEMAVDHRLKFAAGHPDSKRRVPFGNGLEIRGYKPLDIVANVIGQFWGFADDEVCTAIQRPPGRRRR